MALGGAGRALLVLFKGDSTDLTRAADQADRSLNGVDDAAKKSGGGLAKWGAAAGVAAVGVTAVAAVAWDFAQAAAEDEKSALSLANVLKKTAGATDEQVANLETWITKLSQTTAIADDELRPALQRLTAATGHAGRAAELMEVALDIAAGTGKDLGSVVEALAKAQLGNVSGLSRLGLATEDAAGNQKDLNTILGEAQTAFGGLAVAAANSDAGGLAKAQLAMGEMKEQIGSYLLPILGDLARVFLEKVIPAIQTAIAWIEENWPAIQKAIEPVLQAVLELVTTVAAEIKRIFEGPLGQALLAVVVHTFGEIIKVIEPALRFVVDLVRLVGAVLSGDWSKAWDAAKDVVGSFVDVVLALVDVFWTRLKLVWDGLEDALTAPFKAALKFIQDLWDKTIGKLKVPSWAEGLVPGGNTVGGQQAAPALGRTGGAPTGSTGQVVINLPVGADPYATVNALRSAGLRIGGLDLAAAAVR